MMIHFFQQKALLFSILVMALGGFPLSNAFAGSSFCLQNFNLYGPVYALDIELRTRATASTLLREKSPCHLIQFQEVWNQGHIAQVHQLFNPHYLIDSPNRRSRIGLMTLSRWPLLSSETEFFRLNDEGGVLDSLRSLANVRKAFHINEVRIPSEDPAWPDEVVYLINTHLHPTSQALRIAQIVDLAMWRLQNRDKKMLLTGDFNAHHDSLEHQLVQDLLAVQDSAEVFFGTYPKEFCTYCRANPRSWKFSDEVLDYVWFSNQGGSPRQLKVTQVEQNLKGVGKFTLSDHYGVRVHFAWENQEHWKLPKKESTKALIDSALLAAQVLQETRNTDFRSYIEFLHSWSEAQVR